MLDRRDDQYRVLVGQLEGATHGAYSPEAVTEEDEKLYVVTDGDDAGLYTTLENAGDAIGRFLDRRHPDQTPLLVTPETHALDRMDGEAAETLDYELDDIPDEEYKQLLEKASVDV